MRDDFAVFILSHGRADRIYTLDSLLKKGRYTGKWYVVIDNEDSTADEYFKRYKDHVLQFDKLAVSKTFDTADLAEDRRTIVYARNACFELARQIGVKYFLELDDDYTDFQFRVKKERLYTVSSHGMDAICDAFVSCLEKTGASSIAFAQGGDFIGGVKSGKIDVKVLRKCMNSFFCSVDRPFQFVGRINEDVNTYTTLASRGTLFFTSKEIMLVQKTTQSNKGGMTDVYLDKGTYLKSFYTVMMMPSAVKIGTLSGGSHRRIHRKVLWDNVCPLILNEKYKKEI